MELFTTATIELLTALSRIFGSYGVGIIVLTIAVRLMLWPLSVSQQRSMKVMQKMQPKMRIIQERYKSNPQMMQQKMMEFYKENNFNPMGGCLPVLLQMPIFILLYSALMSPQFIEMAGNAKFMFINRLDATIRGTSARSLDGSFNVSGKNDNFVINKKIVVYFNDGTSTELKAGKGDLEVQGTIIPGEPVDLKAGLDVIPLKFAELNNVKAANLEISNRSTREIENIQFKRQGDLLTATVPTVKASQSMNYDVLALVVFFGLSMFLATKVMTLTDKNRQLDPQQEAMQKTMGMTMPLVLTATFFFIPIPAGVLLYLVVSNLIQIIQTVIINKQLEKADIKVIDKSEN